MKLEKWALIAEVTSAIAVVVTLVFLVLGIRDNTAVSRASAYADIIDGFNDTAHLIISDPDLVRIFSEYTARTTSELTEEERARMMQVSLAIFRSFEKAYVSQKYGIVGDAEWDRVVAAICGNYYNTLSLGRDMREFNLLTQEFRDFMAVRCADDPRE